MTVRLLHLTDAHLSSLAHVSPWTLRGKRRLGYLSWRYRRQHELRADVLATVTAAARAERADLIAVTGDLVHIGLAEEIATARAWLAELGDRQRVMLVPGNHDCYRADAARVIVHAWSDFLFDPGAGRAQYPRLREQGDVAMIGLWSAEPMPWWSAGGALGDSQFAALDALLARCAGRFRCVLLHHAPLPEQAPPRKALAEAPALAALLRRHGVELVLHGHLHHNATRTLDQRTRVMVTAPASSAAPHNPAAYRVLDITPSASGWRVDHCLKTLADDGTMQVAMQDTWTVARPSVLAADQDRRGQQQQQ